MTTIKIVRLYDEILEESRTEVMFIRNKKRYVGALFFKPDPTDKIRRTMAEVTIDDDDEASEVQKVIETAIQMSKDWDMKVFKDTEKSMKHWQFVNGFSKVIFR